MIEMELQPSQGVIELYIDQGGLAEGGEVYSFGDPGVGNIAVWVSHPTEPWKRTIGGVTLQQLGVVTTDGEQTLTGKSISGSDNSLSGLRHGQEVDDESLGVHGVSGYVVGTTDTQTLENKTLQTAQLTDGYIEQQGSLTGTTPNITATGGSIKTWSLTGTSTPTLSLSNGQSITLHISGTHAIAWPSGILWVGGLAPILQAGSNIVQLWRINNTYYGALVGVANAA